MLIGLVLGLAVYNAVLLDFPLPIALYRKLLGQPTALRDLKEMDPPLGKSLQQLLDMEGESAHPADTARHLFGQAESLLCTVQASKGPG